MRILRDFAWSGLCAALGVLCLGVWLLSVDTQIALHWRADLWPAQPWVLWTASLVHLSDAHLSLNLLALLSFAIIGQHLGADPRDALAVMLAWPLSNLALQLWPPVQFYAGFSGLNHALAAVLISRAAIQWIVQRQGSWIAFLLAVMLLAKLVWEAAWAQPLRMDDNLGFAVVQAAHLSGCVSGLLAFALIQISRIFFTKAVVE